MPMSGSFVKRERRPIITIGTDTFSRLDLINMRCRFRGAAANLNKLLARFHVGSLEELVNTYSLGEIVDRERFGEVSIALLLDLVKQKGIDENAWADESLDLPATITQRRKAGAKQTRKKNAWRKR